MPSNSLSAAAELAPLLPLCNDVRALYERICRQCGLEGVAGSCLYASVFLEESLANFSSCRKVWICGGDGAGDGGLRDYDGQWHGHYWVEGITATGYEFAADITADQFGLTPCRSSPALRGAPLLSMRDTRLVELAVAEEFPGRIRNVVV